MNPDEQTIIEERAKAFFSANPYVLEVADYGTSTESELDHYCRISAAFARSELTRDSRLREAELAEIKVALGLDATEKHDTTLAAIWGILGGKE